MKRLFIYTYLYMLVMFLVVNYAVVPIYYRVILEDFAHSVGLYWRDILSGFFQNIETDLKHLPVDRWEQAISELQPHFTFPIYIASMDSVQLPAADLLALKQGEIVVQGAGDALRHQIGQSGLLLCMGPIPELGEIPDWKSFQKYMQIIFCALIAVLFSLFALIWTLPLARNLERLGKAATALGQGALDTRAAVSKRSSLAPLASAFNSMADRIQQLIASHRELTHTVSHELRTPLARIRFDMEMMASARDPAARERHHEAIRRNVDELDMLISELLTYAQFDHANFRLQREMLNLGPWLIALIAEENHENGLVRIHCRINATDPNVPAQVNPHFLGRAVRNLLQNASRYSRRRIHVTLETSDRFYMIHVDDDGHGVDLADRQRIFEPFVRLDNDDFESSEREGYGLGLAIVRRVAEWHGGQAMATDAPIGGARFTLRWPIS